MGEGAADFGVIARPAVRIDTASIDHSASALISSIVRYHRRYCLATKVRDGLTAVRVGRRLQRLAGSCRLLHSLAYAMPKNGGDMAPLFPMFKMNRSGG